MSADRRSSTVSHGLTSKQLADGLIELEGRIDSIQEAVGLGLEGCGEGLQKLEARIDGPRRDPMTGDFAKWAARGIVGAAVGAVLAAPVAGILWHVAYELARFTWGLIG